MAIPIRPAKYAVVVNAVQQRIEDGTYPPGAGIPSETQLMNEFDTSRPTVVRALGILQQDGWIESAQGKGRFVKGRPNASAPRPDSHSSDLLNQSEAVGVTLLRVGAVMATNRAATALELDIETPVIARRRLFTAEIGPVEVSTLFVPVELASGTDVSKQEPLPEGILRHLSDRKGIEFDHATERISARLPTAEEVELLGIGTDDAVMTLLVTVFDKVNRPQLAVDSVIPASRQEIEGSFPLH
ncbi:GntR family transcriptional regulator [Actinoplanes sp. RD1]|uniref:GntR family transcriptional regulator n=1 Tax=Actinoplanes sp. RD1 TaxID=3064538 RepID=UPI0027409B6C|nr:GntR family transcriptional regulator [Actinoplanes sp. RD1]